MREEGRWANSRQPRKKQEKERQERNKRQESELCLVDTFKGYTCLIAGGRKAPGDK